MTEAGFGFVAVGF